MAWYAHSSFIFIKIKTGLSFYVSPRSSGSFDSALATPLFRRFRIRGFSFHDCSWIGFIDNVWCSVIPVMWNSNFNAKKNFLIQVIDFKRGVSKIEPTGKRKSAYLRHHGVKVARS
jgi:hypothetical protein